MKFSGYVLTGLRSALSECSCLYIYFLQYFNGTQVCNKTNLHARVEQKRYETRVGELSQEH